MKKVETGERIFQMELVVLYNLQFKVQNDDITIVIHFEALFGENN